MNLPTSPPPPPIIILTFRWTKLICDLPLQDTFYQTSISCLGLRTPDGIAYDWMTGMLYWTDAQENTVNRLTTNHEKEVLVHEKLDEPRAIALSPCDGKLGSSSN